jgi:FkbM family methyltransferase
VHCALADARHACTTQAQAVLLMGTLVAAECASRLQLRPLAHAINRWPLLHSVHGIAHLNWARSDHLVSVEPLSVAAFLYAIQRASNDTVVLDIGANVGAYTLLAGALGKDVLAVEMQPGCQKWHRCHAWQLDQLRGRNRVRFLTRFVASSARHVAPVRVPITGCEVMASPSAVAGRWPHGMRTKETRKLDKATATQLRNTTRLVRPLHIADYVNNQFSHTRSLVAKVDTEGYEIQVLKSMRRLWPRMRALIVELQPSAWTFANVSIVQGLEILMALMAQEAMIAVTLPHAKSEGGVEKRARIDFDPCSYEVRNLGKAEVVTPTVGIDTARVMDAEGLMAFVDFMLRFPGKRGWFHEVLFVRMNDWCKS